MIGEFIINILVLVFGYAYPTFESFRIIERTIERKRPCTDRLLFWCQYWVIIAMITALEKFGDIFVSWVPFYGESKLAFIIYLWHPKTKGTDFVYNTVVRPFMAQHETDIEKRLQGMMSKSANLLIFYLNHFADKGQSIAFEIFEHLLSRSVRKTSSQDDQVSTITLFLSFN